MNDDTITKRFRMPKSHPVLAEITIDVMNWYRFQQLNDHTSETNIIGYDEPVERQVIVYVACVSEDVKKALEDGWN